MKCQNCGQRVESYNEHTTEIGYYTVFTCESDEKNAYHFGNKTRNEEPSHH